MKKPETQSGGSLKPVGSAWQCYLGNGEWDHDWQEKSDSSGEVDGGPGDRWTWRECRVCGQIEEPNNKLRHGGAK